MAKNKIPIHLVFLSIYSVLALLTIIPQETASKTCLLGYNALCTFAPISTGILLILGCFHLFLFYYKRKAQN